MACETADLLQKLSEARGVSGYEGQIRDISRKAFVPYVDEIRENALGSLIGIKRGTRDSGQPTRSIMLAAHTDEIGLMVSGFEGVFLRFARVGGIDVRTIVGQEVIVHARQDLVGIVASRPPHVLTAEERSKPTPLDQLFIDVGLSEDRAHELVRVGDTITMRGGFCKLADGYYAGKAFDDRAGVCTLVVCLQELSQAQHSWDVYAVATSQEEIGLKGAVTSAYGVDPDIGIAVDVTFGQQRGVDESESVEMDGGPAIAVGGNIHPVMRKRLSAIADQYEIKHQFEYEPGATGTDAWAIQVSRGGIPTALLSVPLRYMHTSVETVCIRDVDRTGRLMARFIAALDETFARDLGL